MRSFLFVPGSDERKTLKALKSEADAVILDLEDSVSLSQKPLARQRVASLLSEGRSSGQPKIFVRINALSTREGHEDLAVLDRGGYDGIVQPKAEGGASVLELFEKLPHKKPILAIATETAPSLFKLGDYETAASCLFGLTWGAEDLSNALGAKSSRDEEGMLTDPYKIVRALCLFAAKSIERDAIDTVFVNFKDQESLKRECDQAARDGFTGKMAIHPDQVSVINDVFTPSPQEVMEAREVVSAFEASPEAGVLAIDGKMYDLPHKRRCEKILLRAQMLAR